MSQFLDHNLTQLEKIIALVVKKFKLNSPDKDFIDDFIDKIKEDIEYENYDGSYSDYVKECISRYKENDIDDAVDEFSMSPSKFIENHKNDWEAIFMTVYNAFSKVAK